MKKTALFFALVSVIASSDALANAIWLKWPVVPRAVTYRIGVDEGSDCSTFDTDYEITLDPDQFSVGSDGWARFDQLDNLPCVPHCVAVAAVDESGNRGPWSPRVNNWPTEEFSGGPFVGGTRAYCLPAVPGLARTDLDP